MLCGLDFPSSQEQERSAAELKHNRGVHLHLSLQAIPMQQLLCRLRMHYTSLEPTAHNLNRLHSPLVS